MTDLERRLRSLAPDAFPATPDVSAVVAARLADPDRRGRDRGSARSLFDRFAPRSAAGSADEAPARPARRRRVIALALALVLVPTAAVAAVPDARQAVLEWLGLAHVRVERSPRVRPLPALDRADLGRRVASVAEAARRAGFAVVVPGALGTPEAVYVSDGAIVSLVYGPGAGFPLDAQTGVGVLVTQLRASAITEYVAKMAGPRTVVERVQVGGAPGVFLSGEPHELLIEQPDRRISALPARLAGNTLAFERGGLVIRLEGRFTREQALALARTTGG